MRSKVAGVMISALTMVAGSFVIASSADAAAGARFGADYKLSSNTAGRSDDVPGLTVDPTNQNHIVEANIDPVNLQCEYHVSFDGGKTWAGGTLSLPAPTASIAYPSPACSQNFDSGGYAHFNTGIVFGSGQNVYLTFSIHQGSFNRPESGPSADGGNGDDAVVAHSTDGGQTFQPAVIAVPGGGPTSANAGLAGIGMRPQIAVQRGAGTGGQDRLYVASWNCYIRIRASQSTRGGCSGGGGDRRIWVARSNDGGQTWNAPVLASAAGVRTGGAIAEAGSPDEQAVEPSQPVVGPDGTVYVAYKNRDITDGTTCPANPNRPATTAGFPSTKAYCVVVAKSTDGGTTWTQSNASGPVPSATLINPRLAIDPSVGTTGKLYVVYEKQVVTPPAPPTDPADIFLNSSTDGGTTWSAGVRVNNDAAGAVQTNPWVAVGPGGVIDVAWWDQRNNYPGISVQSGNVYFAQSTDGGATFPTNRRVTDRSINEGVGLYGYLADDFSTGFDWFGPVLLPLADGSILAAWPDSRGGNLDNGFQDIYLSRLSATSGIVKSTMATATPDGLSVLLSRLAYPGGAEASGPTSPISKVVVVNDSDVAGALAGSVLARANWSQLLASPAGGLPAVVKADAARMEPQGAFVIGDTSTLSPTVSSQLASVTQNGENVVRIAPTGSVAVADRPADIARQVAAQMYPLPGATPTAVIVNPGTPEAAAAAGLAAALKYPILFVDTRTSLPGPTSSAISTLGIKKVLIVGGTGAVNAGVETALDTLLGATNVTRIGGADQYAVSANVVNTAISLGLPTNVVYTADGGRPIDGALLGSAVGRLGGLVLLTPGASTDAAETALSAAPLSLDASTDRIVGAIGTGGTDPVLPPPVQHSLIVSLAGPGSGTVTGSGINCPGVCTQTSVSGTSVTLTATPAAGSTFAGWSGNCGGTGSCTGTLSSDLHVTATFFKTPVVPPNAIGRLVLNRAHLIVKRGIVSASFTCASSVSCASRFSITTRARLSKSKKLATVVCATTKPFFKIRAHKSLTVRARVRSACLTRLRKARHHNIVAKLTANPHTGQHAVIRKVFLFLG
ncbi:MAG: cell wall-binding repeat-containing protein [Actinomycetota bacterium]|nr:cell wall-binding repeat-containing protein [Actinomycetota bacterium]